MTARRRIRYRTPHHVGPYRIVALALGGGYAIVDESHTGPRTRYAWTRPHPNNGRPIAAPIRTMPEALRILAELATP